MIKKIRLNSYAEMPNPGLKSYLSRLKAGNPETYTQPFYKGLSQEQLLSKWLAVVKRKQRVLNEIMPGLYEIELQQKEKVGPYSVYPPLDKRMDKLEEYYELVRKPAKDIDSRAIQAVISLFPKKLSLASIKTVLEDTDMSTNAGLPYFTKRRKAAEIYERKGWKQEKPFMAVAGTRVQPGGKEPKVRFVWMFPMLLNVKEQQFYHPLIKYMQNHLLPKWSVYKLRDTEIGVTRLFDTKGVDDLVINTDFTAFDQHFNKACQNAAYKILTSIFDPIACAHIANIFPQKFEIPILIGEERALFGPHGMASGSGGTNSDENLTHKALQYESAIENGAELNPYSACLGDDGIISYPGITVEKVISTYTKHGLEMNTAKQYADKHSTYYLQRYYHTKYRDAENIMLGVYSTFRAIGRLRYEERFHDPDKWDAKQVIYRALQIIENCCNHPLFYDFVDFCKEGDKYHLGMDIPGFFDNIDKAMEEYKANFGSASYTQMNEDSNASNWRVVRYLRNGEKDF